MSIILAPDQPLVEQGATFTLAFQSGNDSWRHQQFIVHKPFDYPAMLESIRLDGALKTEQVFVRLSELLVQDGYASPVHSYVLDLGQQGRASKALKECQEYSLNNEGLVVKNLIVDISKQLFSFNGPEGMLHVLKADNGETLGQVTVMLDTESGILKKFTLDVVGPGDADFPDDFREDIEFELKAFIATHYPDLHYSIVVRVQRSELALATGALLE